MVEDMGIAAPNEIRRVAVVVAGVIIFRRSNGQPLIFIAEVFLRQRIPVVLKMTENEETAVIRCADDVDAVVDVAGKDIQSWCIIDGNIVDGCMAGLGDEITVVKTAQEGMVAYGQLIFINAKKLGR